MVQSPKCKTCGGTGEHDVKVDSNWTPQAKLAVVDNKFETKSASPIPFFHLLERLKTTKRRGWILSNVSGGESISDHMYRMAIMTMFAPDSLGVDRIKCMRMALIHDMAEAIVGDITPHDEVPKKDKNRAEATSMSYIAQQLLGNVEDGRIGQELVDIWQEYEDNETKEAKFVHDVDKFELLLQTCEYERSRKKDLAEYTGVGKFIELPEVKAWLEDIRREREILREEREAQVKSSSVQSETSAANGTI